MSTKEQILAAAISTFSRKGYKNATIKEIAQKADVNSLTIFRHFYDKKMLFLEAVDRMKEDDFDKESLDGKLTYCDVEADLLEMTKAYLNEICAHIPLIRIYIGDGFNFDELKKEAWFIMPTLKEHFLSYLEKVEHVAPLAQEYGEFLAEMFVSYITRKVMPSNKHQDVWTLTPEFAEKFMFDMGPQAKCMAFMITGHLPDKTGDNGSE